MRYCHFFFCIGLILPSFSEAAPAAGPYPVTIDTMVQVDPAYLGFYLDSGSSTVPVNLSFVLINNTNPKVTITSSTDPVFPTTCTATLIPNSHCMIWVHAVHNFYDYINTTLGITISYQGIPVESENYPLSNPSTPVFSGKWYAVGVNLNEPDNCGTYTNRQYLYPPQPSAEQAALGAMQPVSGCTWTIIESHTSTLPPPDDFPGDYNQWQEAMAQNPGILSVNYYLNCIAPDGKKIIAAASLTVYPEYFCPRGALQQGVGCYMPQQLCQGDVGGRDLDYDEPPIKIFGHVALTNAFHTFSVSQGSVIQVMNSDHPLNNPESIENFKKDSTYWGARYGVNNITSYTQTQGEAIITAAAQQQSLGDGFYTYLPVFQPVQDAVAQVYNAATKTWQSKLTTFMPTFRCDTFVDWVYYQALNQEILWFFEVPPPTPWPSGEKTYSYVNPANSPSTLFNTLLNVRWHSSTSSGRMADENPALTNQISLIVNDLKSTTSINRPEKIAKYWQQLNQATDDMQVQLALDALYFLKPIGLIPSLIQRYHQADDAQIKHQLLALVISSLEIRPDVVNESDLSALTAGQNFLQAEIAEQTNPDLLALAIEGYINVMPYSDQTAAAADTAIQRLAALKQVTVQSLFAYSLLLALNDSSGQRLNVLTEAMETSPFGDDFQRAVIGHIANGLRADMLSNSVNTTLNLYLENEIKVIPEEARDIDLSQSNEYYSLLKAVTAFNDDSADLTNRIAAINNPALLGGVITAAIDDLTRPEIGEALKANQEALLTKLRQGKSSAITLNQMRLIDMGIIKLTGSVNING